MSVGVCQSLDGFSRGHNYSSDIIISVRYQFAKENNSPSALRVFDGK